MRVLALASQKGGSGKTTLSGHLAVQAQRAGAGPVVLIDIDPQGSLADWWNEREAEYPAFAHTTVARLANEVDLFVAGKDGGEPAPHDGVVVHDRYPDVRPRFFHAVSPVKFSGCFHYIVIRG